MEESALTQKIAELEKKIDAIYVTVEKTRKYYLLSTAMTFVAFVLPLIGLAFVIPTFLSNYGSILNLQ